MPALRLDAWLLCAGLLLLALGLLMVTSASMPIADREAGQPFYYLTRQGAYIGTALLCAFLTLKIPLEFWRRAEPLLLLAAVVLLVLVLVIGKEVNGSRRWIVLGPISVQVSELIKLFALFYVAAYLQRHGDALKVSVMAMMRPIIVLGALSILLLLEPDFGAAAVLMATVLGMVFLAGVNIWRFAALQGLILIAMAALLYFSPYRWARLTSFLNAWDDPFGTDFQLIQSLIAIGRGELLGVGLGASIQKLFYLPEAYTDFLFAILAEELGLTGVITVICLYVIIVVRAFAIGAHADWLERRFAAFMAYGIGLWFALQALVNMGVNMGVLPTKGLTLPLMSYGGSSMVVMCVSLAVLLRVDLENRGADPRLQRQALVEGGPR
jgi:cell division protein FtsW